MKRCLCALSLLGWASFVAPAFACMSIIDLNPRAPAFVPASMNIVSLNKLFKLEAGTRGVFRLGLMAPKDSWKIQFANGAWSDILQPTENALVSGWAERDGDVVTLHLSGKAPGQTFFNLAYFPQKGSPAYKPAQALKLINPIVVQVLPREVYAPPVLVVAGDVAGKYAPTYGNSSFFIRLPPAAPDRQWEVTEAVATTSSPRAEQPAPWEPMGSGPTRVENGDFRVWTPYSGTMRIVFAQKGDGAEGQAAAITIILEVPPRPAC